MVAFYTSQLACNPRIVNDKCAPFGAHSKFLNSRNKAHFLYLTRNSAEGGQLLKSVLLNCPTDGVSLWPAYSKLFDLFQRAKNEDWSALEDDFRNFLFFGGLSSPIKCINP